MSRVCPPFVFSSSSFSFFFPPFFPLSLLFFFISLFHILHSTFPFFSLFFFLFQPLVSLFLLLPHLRTFPFQHLWFMIYYDLSYWKKKKKRKKKKRKTGVSVCIKSELSYSARFCPSPSQMTKMLSIMHQRIRSCVPFSARLVMSDCSFPVVGPVGTLPSPGLRHVLAKC